MCLVITNNKMTVKELIKELKKCDWDLKVVCVKDSMDYTPSNLEIRDCLNYDTETKKAIWETCIYIF